MHFGGMFIIITILANLVKSNLLISHLWIFYENILIIIKFWGQAPVLSSKKGCNVILLNKNIEI